jgi:integrase/recombinase XerD
MMVLNHSIVDFPELLQRFFGERLISQKDVSKCTVAAYRDTFKLLLRYIHEKYHVAPSELTFDHLCPDTVTGFLSYLETERRNSVRTRNARLAAIRSFLNYAAALDPASIATIQRLLAIPSKRFHRSIVGFLSREEIHAILDAPNSSSFSGRRDRALFLTLYNTGARVSEIIGVTMKDVNLICHSSIILHGKGRKERSIPLWRRTVRELKKWIDELENAKPDALLFPAAGGRPLTRSGVEYRLRLAAIIARSTCSSISHKKISPHIIRHTTAMHLLQSGIDLSVIALWLGHEKPSTTHMYMEADLAMKRRALETLEAPSFKGIQKHRSSDKLLRFLDTL